MCFSPLPGLRADFTSYLLQCFASHVPWEGKPHQAGQRSFCSQSRWVLREALGGFFRAGGGHVRPFVHYISQDGLGFAAGTDNCKVSRGLTPQKFFSCTSCVPLGSRRALLDVVIRGPGWQRLHLNTCFHSPRWGKGMCKLLSRSYTSCRKSHVSLCLHVIVVHK